jgi:tRNA (guanine37-N1)-methyltransferase
VKRIDVITIFPELFAAFREAGVLGQAIGRGELTLEAHDLRRWTSDRHRSVDDIPYGGGPGMVMKPEPLVEAIEAVAGAKGPRRTARVLLMSPQGELFTQEKARELAGEERLAIVCGRYEGVDQRAIELAIDAEISVGDYVLSGGEVAAMVVIEALSRFVPGVLGNPESVAAESFQQGVLEGPQYTRPAEYRGLAVPDVLRSGDHAKIARWRADEALALTKKRRPDLLTRSRAEGEKS